MRCRGYQACYPRQYLIDHQWWPLTRAGAVHSLAGPDPPILVGPLLRDAQGRPISVRFTLLVPNGEDFYALYGLQGGP